MRIVKLLLAIATIVIALGIVLGLANMAIGAEEPVSRVDLDEANKWPFIGLGKTEDGIVILGATRPEPVEGEVNKVMFFVHPSNGAIIAYVYEWKEIKELWVFDPETGEYVFVPTGTES